MRIYCGKYCCEVIIIIVLFLFSIVMTSTPVKRKATAEPSVDQSPIAVTSVSIVRCD